MLVSMSPWLRCTIIPLCVSGSLTLCNIAQRDPAATGKLRQNVRQIPYPKQKLLHGKVFAEYTQRRSIDAAMQQREFSEYVEAERPDPKDIRVSARITPDLAEQMRYVCQVNQWKPSYVIRGGIKKFLDECAPPQAKFK